MRSYFHGMLSLIACLLLGIASSSHAAEANDHNWPQWRGPQFNGASDASNLPDALSREKNLLWSVHLPGAGNGTPIVWGNRVFVSVVDPNKKLLGLCIDLKSGKTLWQHEAGISAKQNGNNNQATPSAVTDGKTVWFYFGSGDLAALDFDGKLLWSRNIQKDQGSFNFMWIYGSSPLLYKGTLYIQVLHRDKSYDHNDSGGNPADSYLLAIDPQTGKDLWKQVRPTTAQGESKEAYTTPIPVEVNGQSQVVLIGGDAVTGHDARTGQEIWRYTGWNPGDNGRYHSDFRMVPSVSAGAGIVVACAPKGGPIMAIKADSRGKVTNADLAWRSKELSSDVCVPLFYQHKLYVLNGDRKTLSCVDPKTGKIQWSGSLGGHAVFRASPTGADGKIYCLNESGDVWVISAAEFKVLSQNALDGRPTRASIAVTDGAAVARAGEMLFAFGRK